MTDTNSIFQIKVTLEETEPSIWRRFQVQVYKSLHELHLTLQTVMGWTDSHLYMFRQGDAYFGEPYYFDDIEVTEPRRVRLDQVVNGVEARLIYEYDFGDSWEHEILIEKILVAEQGRTYPICLDGRRSCPPEDCGGASGYKNLLEALGNSCHEDHTAMREWAGEDFDPEAFDVGQVNRMLSQALKKREFTRRQGQYMAFIHYFTRINGHPPSIADMQRHFEV